MTEDMWTNLIAPEVLKQCDALDGVRPSAVYWQDTFSTCFFQLADGIVSDPRNCK